MSWGSVIAAGGSLLGGILSDKAAGDRHDSQMAMSERQLQMQKQFAQEGIRWRVADAKAAGIHPLYALGASIPSYSPATFVPGDGGGSFGRGLGEAASHFGRAIDAARTPEEQVDSRLSELSITRAELENDLLRSQIARLNQSPSVGLPAVTENQVFPGQADVERNGLLVKPASSHVVGKAQEVTVSHPENVTQEPMAINDVGFVRTPTGYAPVPSGDVKQRIEDQFVPEAMWALRNHFIPSVGGGSPPPKSWLPDGAYSWRYEVASQEWQPVFRRPGFKPTATDFWDRAADAPWKSWSGRSYMGRSRVGSYW